MQDNRSPVLSTFCLLLLLLAFRLLPLSGHPYLTRSMAILLVMINVLLLLALRRVTTTPNPRKLVLALGALSSTLAIGVSLWSVA